MSRTPAPFSVYESRHISGFSCLSDRSSGVTHIVNLLVLLIPTIPVLLLTWNDSSNSRMKLPRQTVLPSSALMASARPEAPARKVRQSVLWKHLWIFSFNFWKTVVNDSFYNPEPCNLTDNLTALRDSWQDDWIVGPYTLQWTKPW